MKNALKWLVFVGFLATILGCQTFSELIGSDDQGTEGKEKKSMAYSNTGSEEDVDLKYAKLWARLDEIQEKLSALQEKTHLIEKNMALGLASGPIQGNFDAEPEQMPDISHKDSHISKPKLEIVPEPSEPEEKSLQQSSTNDSIFEQKFSNVHENYKLGNYGKAIVHLMEIRNQFGDTYRDGIHVYWIGKCWLALKEYETAKSHLTDFISHQPDSKYLSRAKFDLAIVYYKTGFRNQSVSLLRDIINEYPYKDVSEMAKLQLEKMRKEI